ELANENPQRDAVGYRANLDEKVKMIGHDHERRDLFAAAPLQMKAPDGRRERAGDRVFDEEQQYDFDVEAYQKDEAGNALNETYIEIDAKYYLYLSGTPFRAINSGEFIEGQIFNWTYSDEQTAKRDWAGDGRPCGMGLRRYGRMAGGLE
ncbi:MAG: hypothetical protein SPG40_11270, partial [Kiritimatiellia bacterium]|nr:hypothetical protein [Kiritimatiellia bacterium]